MKRTVIKIDEELCNGCGNCVRGCHEGALQLINGKAVMISDLYCDGLGACIGDCPVGAIELIEKETEPYNESAVMERIHTKGEDVILAHLKHLRDHNQTKWFNEGIDWLSENNITLQPQFAPTAPLSGASELQQWPVQLHLLNPAADFFQGTDLLLASDCSAFTSGSFHSQFLKNKALAIACPKLDSNTESYVQKITEMIDQSKINTITVLMMEVPCCGGLMRIVEMAKNNARRNVPVKSIIMSVKGDVLSEEWVA
jgi:NAD-dependent dihydropyrimidine dehydrogenase PreA subunit